MSTPPAASGTPNPSGKTELKRGHSGHSDSDVKQAEDGGAEIQEGGKEDPREAALRASNTDLERQIQELGAQRDEIVSGLRNKDPSKTVQTHIRLLHEYNEMRDVALGLMGLVADNRGCEVKEVMTEFGLDPREK
ncbi:Swi5-domain-containing protein [Ascodesmis nigricans]|uniref:Swi5-domain-containing protein n=1 Tax=Ascodesmis nigricans TaxID=341454 RepID=A0A4S2MLF2_9PEZI|nr:Swi5-domain-containing protein [Ascodesmis nigricans]